MRDVGPNWLAQQSNALFWLSLTGFLSFTILSDLDGNLLVSVSVFLGLLVGLVLALAPFWSNAPEGGVPLR